MSEPFFYFHPTAYLFKFAFHSLFLTPHIPQHPKIAPESSVTQLPSPGPVKCESVEEDRRRRELATHGHNWVSSQRSIRGQ